MSSSVPILESYALRIGVESPSLDEKWPLQCVSIDKVPLSNRRGAWPAFRKISEPATPGLRANSGNLLSILHIQDTT